MKTTAKQNKARQVLLAKAYELLKTYRESTVCLAISQAANELGFSVQDFNEYQEAATYLNELVSNVMGEHASLESYLSGQSVDTEKLAQDAKTEHHKYMRKLRLSWMKWMIQDLNNECTAKN